VPPGGRGGFPTDPTIVSLFDEAVHNFPKSVAVEEESSSVTFSGVAKRVEVVCHYLSRAGVYADKVVPILFDHSIDMIATIVGVLKSGAVYCPINVDSLEQRL